MRTLSLVLVTLIWQAVGGMGLSQEQRSAGIRPTIRIQITFAEFSSTDNLSPLESIQDAEDPTAMVAHFAEQGLLVSKFEANLYGVADEKTTLSIQDTIPIKVGQTVGGRGGPGGFTQSQFINQNFGTMISVVPRLNDEGNIELTYTFERSRPVYQKEAAEGQDGSEQPAAGIPTPRPSSFTAGSTIVIPAQQTVVAGGTGSVKVGDQRQVEKNHMVLLLSAKVLGGSGRSNKIAQEVPPTDRKPIKNIHLRHAAAATAADVLRDVLKGEPIEIAVDERTNSLILKGSAEATEIAEALLLKIDEGESR